MPMSNKKLQCNVGNMLDKINFSLCKWQTSRLDFGENVRGGGKIFRGGGTIFSSSQQREK